MKKLMMVMLSIVFLSNLNIYSVVVTGTAPDSCSNICAKKGYKSGTQTGSQFVVGQGIVISCNCSAATTVASYGPTISLIN
ncbi:MAG: hypothetical protein P4L22_00730 [Candidatus Babeliales bacterium]|nr:hypothetical protein [Candidatus Babeliales bacterium]